MMCLCCEDLNLNFKKHFEHNIYDLEEAGAYFYYFKVNNNIMEMSQIHNHSRHLINEILETNKMKIKIKILYNLS